MLMDALDSWLEAKQKEKRMQGQASASPQDAMAMDPQMQQVRATLGEGGVPDFMKHMGMTLGARMLDKTGLDAFGVGQDSQAMQNALAYQQDRPMPMQGGSTQGLTGALNVQPQGGDDQSNLKKMINMYMQMAGK